MVDLLLGIHISGTSFRKVNQSNRGCNCTGSSPLASRPESGMAWFPKICGPENGGFVFLFGFQMAIFFRKKWGLTSGFRDTLSSDPFESGGWISQDSPYIHFQTMFYGCRHRCEPCGFSLTSGITKRSAWWFYQHFSRLFMGFHAWLVVLQPNIPRDFRILQDPLKNLWFSRGRGRKKKNCNELGQHSGGFFWDLHRHGSLRRSFHFYFSIKLLETQVHPTWLGNLLGWLFFWWP